MGIQRDRRLQSSLAKLQKAQEPIPFSARKLVPCLYSCGICDSKDSCALAIQFHRRYFVARSAYHYGESLIGMALPAVRGSVLHHVVVFQRPVRSTLFPLRIAEVFGRPEFHRCTMNCWTFNCQLLVNAVTVDIPGQYSKFPVFPTYQAPPGNSGDRAANFWNSEPWTGGKEGFRRSHLFAFRFRLWVAAV